MVHCIKGILCIVNAFHVYNHRHHRHHHSYDNHHYHNHHNHHHLYHHHPHRHYCNLEQQAPILKARKLAISGENLLPAPRISTSMQGIYQTCGEFCLWKKKGERWGPKFPQGLNLYVSKTTQYIFISQPILILYLSNSSKISTNTETAMLDSASCRPRL